MVKLKYKIAAACFACVDTTNDQLTSQWAVFVRLF